jgi:hypothetical protein
MFWGAEVGRAGCVGVIVPKREAVLNRELLGVFRFMPDVFRFMPDVQYWSIPKRGPETDDSGLEKSIPEKSNELNDVDMLLAEYKSVDVDLRNSVIGESALGGCATPLCVMAGSWEVRVGCGLVSVEGVVRNCGLVTAVSDCEPIVDGFTMVVWHCELAMGDGGAVMPWVWICGLTTTAGIWEMAAVWCRFTNKESGGELWECGLGAVGVCKLVTVANVELWCCGGTVAKFGVTAAGFFVATGGKLWGCGLEVGVCKVTVATVGFDGELWGCRGTGAGFGVTVAGFFVASTQSDARLCRSSIAKTLIRFIHMNYIKKLTMSQPQKIVPRRN